MAKVILLCGKIASGKTTYAKRLCETKDKIITLSVDECMLELVQHCVGREAHVRMEQGILTYFYRLSERMIKKGFCVIIDHGYWEKQERVQAISCFQAHGIEAAFHYFPVDEQTQLARLTKRNRSIDAAKKQYGIDKAKCLALNRYFEEPSEEELKQMQVISSAAAGEISKWK